MFCTSMSKTMQENLWMMLVIFGTTWIMISWIACALVFQNTFASEQIHIM